MADPKRDQLKVKNQKAILAAVFEPGQFDAVDPLDELKGLVETAGVDVVGTLTQSRRTPNPATLFGSGKVEELKMLVESLGAELVVVDNNLSPSQARNLEKAIDTVIVDRSEVILDIFASRARTHEAKLQVELAQLLYFRPRLKRMWTHLERIEGGVGAGRGPGEKQLETDRRLVDKRIDELKRKLASVENHRGRMVSQRNEHMTVSFVGYTNAGKSTLMNAVTGSDIYAADQLFATLDTRTRKWKVPHWGDVLLSDTVGFVRNLPHHLVASFRSTLEEARHADLLLHVVDSSHPEAARQIETVNEVLDEIGVDHSNAILVFNKCDAVEDRSIVDVLRLKHEDAVTVSAKSGEGIDRLCRAVARRLGDGFVTIRVSGHAGDGKLLHFLSEHSLVVKTDYVDSEVVFECRIAHKTLHRLDAFEAKVVVEMSARTVEEIADAVADSA
ncbi:MAG: GTPase HflX [Planctomycetota bacterium]|nr:GTPase HflX [Planctomycetota bacterium]MDA1251393.1 GTPase HflX [Planctomycetota bacterium]